MTLQLTISAFFETSVFDAQTAARERRIQGLLNGLEQVDQKTKMSFNKVMNVMRGSYMIVSGITRVIGGGFSRVFQGVWSAITSAILANKAIAAAVAASSPWGWIQAGVMLASLTMASMNVAALMSGQKNIARQARGLNFALHGISSMIQGFTI